MTATTDHLPDSPDRMRLAIRATLAERLKPPPLLTVSQWADRERRLSPKSSAEPGRWRTSRAEYQRDILDAASDPAVDELVFMSSAQVGKTEIINNIVGFHVDQDPAPILAVLPTLELAQSWSKHRLADMLRDTPALRGKVASARARDGNNTIREKEFPGGFLSIVGANSPVGLSSKPIRIVLADEVDRFPPSAGTEGDPVNLAAQRTETFWNRLIVLTSTPTDKGLSRIEDAYEHSDRRKFWVPCPDCGKPQILRWKQVKWEPGDHASAVYVCEHCGSVWDDVPRWRAVNKGEWIAEAEFTGRAGFWLNALYSPWVRLGKLASEWIQAQETPEKLKTFINTKLGESWEERGETVDHTGLMARREDYPSRDGQLLIPDQVAVLTAGVDVQEDRLEALVVGWGVGEEAWSIDWIQLWGDPTGDAVWDDLDNYLITRWPREVRGYQSVQAACVDAGYQTQRVGQFCRPRFGRRIWAVKGRSEVGKATSPLWPRKPTINNKAGTHLFMLGTAAGKEVIYGSLKRQKPGPHFIHFPITEAHNDDYFKQLTAEKIVIRRSNGYPYKAWWLKPGQRNEVLDLWVYAYAALIGLLERGWDLERKLTEVRANPPGAEATQPTKSKGRRVRSKGIRHGR